MNKKLLALVGVIALGVGGVSVVALQSHAQNVAAQPTAITAPAVVATPTQGNTVTDTDNIQNDPNGVEKPDAPSTMKQGAIQDQAETDVANPNEVEDGN